MKIAITALLSLLTIGCMQSSEQVPEVQRQATVHHAVASAPVPASVLADPDHDSCVTDGCPDGLACDWLQGCVAQVTFCCGDSACPAGDFCDFNSGATCQPK